jgi:hypothetical protein
MFTPARDFLLETPWRIIVYPCQRFSSGNTLEDYNP